MGKGNQVVKIFVPYCTDIFIKKTATSIHYTIGYCLFSLDGKTLRTIGKLLAHQQFSGETETPQNIFACFFLTSTYLDFHTVLNSCMYCTPS